MSQVQQQPNFSDCGIYLLQYVESFFRTPISDYTLPITSLRSWFPEEEVRLPFHTRLRIRSLCCPCFLKCRYSKGFRSAISPSYRICNIEPVSKTRSKLSMYGTHVEPQQYFKDYEESLVSIFNMAEHSGESFSLWNFFKFRI